MRTHLGGIAGAGDLDGVTIADDRRDRLHEDDRELGLGQAGLGGVALVV